MEQTEGEVQHLRPGQDLQGQYSWYKLEKCSTSDQDKIRRVSTHGTNWRRSTAPKTRTRSAGWVLMIQTGEVQHLRPGQDPQGEYSWNKLKEKYSTSDQDKIHRVSTRGTNWRRSTAPQTRTRYAGWVLMEQTEGDVQHLWLGQDTQAEYSWNKLKEKYSTSDQDKIHRVSTRGTNWRRSTAPQTRTRYAGWVLMEQTEGDVQHLWLGQDTQGEYSWNKLKEKYSTSDQDKIRRVSTYGTNWRSAAPHTRTRSVGWVLESRGTNWRRSTAPKTRTRYTGWVLMEHTEREVQHLWLGQDTQGEYLRNKLKEKYSTSDQDKIQRVSTHGTNWRRCTAPLTRTRCTMTFCILYLQVKMSGILCHDIHDEYYFVEIGRYHCYYIPRTEGSGDVMVLRQSRPPPAMVLTRKLKNHGMDCSQIWYTHW